MDYQMDWPGDEVRPAANTVERENVPEGRHRFEIVRASEDGPKLKLALSKVTDGELDKRFGWVWMNTPRDKDWGKRMVAGLAAALGLSPEAWKATKVADLEGRQVDAEIAHRQTDRLWINVDRFYGPDAEAKPQPATPARKPAAAPQLETDDIPF